jgi:hypothetical protein
MARQLAQLGRPKPNQDSKLEVALRERASQLGYALIKDRGCYELIALETSETYVVSTDLNIIRRNLREIRDLLNADINPKSKPKHNLHQLSNISTPKTFDFYLRP